MPLRLSMRGLRLAMWLTLVVTVLSLTATGSFAAHVDAHESDTREAAGLAEPADLGEPEDFPAPADLSESEGVREPEEETVPGEFAESSDLAESRNPAEPADVPEPHEDDAPERSGQSTPSEDQTAPAQEDATPDGPAPTSLGGPPVVLSNGSFIPSCEEGYVYNLRSTGLMQQIDPNGVVSDFGERVPFADGTSFNALGIGADGQGVFALSRTGDGANRGGDIWVFDTTTGTWSNTGVTMADSETNLIAGAVDLSTGLFYFGGYMSNGDFKIFEYNPNTNALSVKGIVETENTGIASGDIDFDAAGNLFIVSGSAGKTKIYSVTRTDFEAANGGPIPSSVSAEVDAMASVAGVTFDASGKVFLSAQQELRSYDMPDWSNAQTVATGDDGLHISTDLAGCSSPPSITIEKYVEGGRVDDTDQFDLTLHHGSQLLGEATTQGDATGVQSQRIGPLPTLRNVQLTFEETGAGTTDLDNYVTSYRCLVDGVQQTQGNATTGSVTIPTGGDVVECRLHNSPLIANVNIHKDLVDTQGENPTPAHDWTVGLGATPSTGTVTPEPTSPTQTTDSSGDAAWELRFNNFQDRATVAVSETQEQGYEFESATCVITHLDGTTTTHDLPSESAYDVDGVAPGDHMECVYTNKQMPGSVAWNKVDNTPQATLLSGSTWKITGPGFPSAGQEITDCSTGQGGACSGVDLDPTAGQFLIQDLAWGSYTITETQTPDHHSGSASFTFTVDASTAGTVIDRGDQVNDRDLGALTWTKVDETGAPLGGTTWRVDGDELAQPIEVTDCVAASASACQDADLDPAEGGFHISDLPWGGYELTEVTAADGYFLLTDPIPFTIQPGSGLEVDLGQIANHPIVYPEIPLTGGTSHLAFIGGGLGAGLLALGVHAMASLRRRR